MGLISFLFSTINHGFTIYTTHALRFYNHLSPPLFFLPENLKEMAGSFKAIAADGCAGNREWHVLAVDDSIVDRKLIERLLKLSSYRGSDRLLLFVNYSETV